MTKGKASELADDLLRGSLSPKEMAATPPKLPELRLRADAPAVDVDETTSARDVCDQLHGENVGSIALREIATGVTSIMMPVERYLELVGKELANDPSNKVATLDGRIVPTDSDIAASYVEQVNPNETWTPSIV